MSTVRRGVDTCTGRPVALKLLASHLAGDRTYRERLIDEARAAARLPHPGIVQVLDWGGTTDGDVVLVMELVEGETLANRLQHGPLPVGEAVSIGAAVAEALGFAHGRGVIHRDVKPHNILLPRRTAREPASPAPLAKLADFGIARAIDATSHTTTGIVMGSAPYIAPELLQGEAATAASDLYALGVTLFQSVTGRLPFPAATPAESLTRRLLEDAPPLRRLVPIAPPELELLVGQLLARLPAERPRSAGDVAAALRGQLAPPQIALPAWAAPTVPVDIGALPRRRSAAPASDVSVQRARYGGNAQVPPVDSQRPSVAPQRPSVAPQPRGAVQVGVAVVQPPAPPRRLDWAGASAGLSAVEGS